MSELQEKFTEEMLHRITEKKGGFALHNLFLYNLIIGMEAKNVLELGAGFSTRVILSALEKTGGTLTTCDMRDIKDTGNDPALKEAYSTWTYLQGDTRTTLNTLKTKSFDVVLHDGSHEWRTVYKDLRTILPHMKKDGIILVHDTEHLPTFHLKLAVRLALLFTPHERVTLPYGYGLTIIRIKRDFGNDSVSLTWRKKSE
jgi:predicted O-methyltransferase YrrM